MTENKPIIINELGCNICPDKKRCDEQRERKDNIINSILDDIKDTAIAYNCNLKDKIEILKQNLPIITRCDIVLEKQLARKTQECEELKKTLTFFMDGEYCNDEYKKLQEAYAINNFIIMDNEKLKQTLAEIKNIANKDFRHTSWEEYAKQLKQIIQKISEVE